VAISQPAEHLSQRVECRSGRLSRVEVTNHTNELGITLVAAGGVPGHRPGQASLSAFPHHSLGIDDEVVSDVVPALVRASVIVEPATENVWCVGARMTVVRCGMVDNEKLHVL